MKMKHIFALVVVFAAAVVLSACGPRAPIPTEEIPVPTEEVTVEATEVEPTATEETPEPEPATPAEPQRLEFETPDGVTLVGLLYPTTTPPAPVIILMHTAGATKEEWEPISLALQRGSIELASLGRLAQPAASYPSYNVFAFDFRDHGESDPAPEGSDVMAGWLIDAYTALAFVQTLDGVEPGSTVMVGSSIGADAAVDACSGMGLPGDYPELAGISASCVAAMPVSPGSHLGIPYPVAVAEMGGRPVCCVAADGDIYAVETCGQGDQVASENGHESAIYTGDYHGAPIFWECASQTAPPRYMPPLALLQAWVAEALAGG